MREVPQTRTLVPIRIPFLFCRLAIIGKKQLCEFVRGLPAKVIGAEYRERRIT